MKFTTILAVLPCVAAWPAVLSVDSELQKRAEPPPRKPNFLSKRQNTGVVPPAGFNAEEQYVDVSRGSGHAFVAPKESDIRGQCPGLNAAANHGFLPHNGIVSIQQTIDGLRDAYNMGEDLALFLAVVSVGLAGDPVKRTWSIGTEYQGTIPGLPATGIAGTHNQYESDASIVRGDAYLNGGNVGVFQMRSWEKFYAMGPTFDLNDAAAQSDYQTRWSIMNNPYYFSAPFAGLVAPAAHNFVINFMSNRSASNPGGVLNRNVLKSFFAVTGNKPGEFVNHRGMERIPGNWYKRPNGNKYSIPNVLSDVAVNNAMYPGIVRFGGNTGTTNTFTGIDITSLTRGAFNGATLLKGNNAACFFLQASMQGLPDVSDPLLGAVGSVTGWALRELGPLGRKFGCGSLRKFDNSLFEGFPGAKYKAEGQEGGFLGGVLGKGRMFRS